jgi:hypothetical protein
VILLVSGFKALAFITLVIVVLVAIGILFFVFLKSDSRREVGNGKLDDHGP